MMRTQNIHVKLDPDTDLRVFMKTKLWTIRRGGLRRSHSEMHLVNRPDMSKWTPSGHTIARGRLVLPSTLKVTKSEIPLAEIRDLIEGSGTNYEIKVVAGSKSLPKRKRR